MAATDDTPRTRITWDYAPAPESPDHVRLRDSYGLFIGGEFVDPRDGRREASVSPATEEPVAEVAFAGEADFLFGRLPDLRERLLAGRIDRRVALLRLQPFAPDEMAVPLAELDDLARLRRGRVLPPGRNGRAILLSLELSQS